MIKSRKILCCFFLSILSTTSIEILNIPLAFANTKTIENEGRITCVNMEELEKICSPGSGGCVIDGTLYMVCYGGIDKNVTCDSLPSLPPIDDSLNDGDLWTKINRICTARHECFHVKYDGGGTGCMNEFGSYNDEIECLRDALSRYCSADDLRTINRFPHTCSLSLRYLESREQLLMYLRCRQVGNSHEDCVKKIKDKYHDDSFNADLYKDCMEIQSPRPEAW